jgi:hypothetical protein
MDQAASFHPRGEKLLGPDARRLVGTRPGENDDFSLILGGPFYQLFCRAHLCGHVLELLRRRVLTLCGVAWLPLLVFSLCEGNAWGGAGRLWFLADVEPHARFLIAMPLLVMAELAIHERMRPVVRQFLERGLVPENAREKFENAIASAMRLRNSFVAEACLIVVVYAVSVFMWQRHIVINAGTWHGSVVDGAFRPTLAGWWFRCVSLPLLQFLLLRWYYRIFIWTRFLWQVSRIDLQFNAGHPDRAAGIGFLALISYAFTPLLLAQGALVAGVIADRIFYSGAKLPQFKAEIIVLVVVAIFTVVGPLLVFAPRLARTKRVALREYGTFAQRYVREFEQKWLHGGAPAGENVLGTSDIQSLADLGNSFEIVRQMKILPFSVQELVRLVIVALVPIAPLILTVIPAEELFKRLLNIAF